MKQHLFTPVLTTLLDFTQPFSHVTRCFLCGLRCHVSSEDLMMRSNGILCQPFTEFWRAWLQHHKRRIPCCSLRTSYILPFCIWATFKVLHTTRPYNSCELWREKSRFSMAGSQNWTISILSLYHTGSTHRWVISPDRTCPLPLTQPRDTTIIVLPISKMHAQ